MPHNDHARIAFVYSGLVAPGVMAGDTTPCLTIACNEFPSKATISVNFGVIGFNGIDHYSLDVKIFHNDEDVTTPISGERNLFNYRPQWSDDGEYVATMAIIESFTAKAPGSYRVEASLLFKEAKEEAVWDSIDVKSSYFAVAKEWRNDIAPQG